MEELQRTQSSTSLEQVAQAVLNRVAERTRGDYRRALLGSTGKRATGAEPLGFLPWIVEQRAVINRYTVNTYIAYLKESGTTISSINQRLSAIRHLVKEAAESGWLDPVIAATIKAINDLKAPSRKLGNWLTIRQAEQMLNAPLADTFKGLRDRAVLAILLGAGLRRTEVASLTVEHFQQREGRWVILDLVGKGSKTRTIPIAGWVKARVDAWLDCAGINSGVLFHRIRRGGHVSNEGMTAQAIWEIVQEYAPVPNLAPHDLRRSFAKLARRDGAPLEQIQLCLGHESLDTTRKYLGSELDLQQSPSDYIRFNLEED